MSGYVRQSAGLIVNGATIQDSHFNNEFNQLQAAFDGTTGHTHSGGAGDGPPIIAAGLASDSVTTAKILNSNVTYAKIQNVAANKVLGSIAGGVVEEIDATATGRSILGAANAAAVRTASGLVIGTDVQAYSAKLAALASLAWAQDYFPLFTGVSGVTSRYMSIYMQDVIAASDEEELRSLAGAPGVAQQEIFCGFISFPVDKTYTVALKMPYACEIYAVTAKCATGTCTATFKVDTTALAGGAISVTTTETTVSQPDVFVNTDKDINLTISASSGITDLAFSIAVTRQLD